MNKKAIIVGCEGQDGSLLYDLLINRNYKIIGLARTSIKSNDSCWHKAIDITNSSHVNDLIRKFRPVEIYYLAAFHQSSEQQTTNSETKGFAESFTVNAFGLVNFLEAIRQFSPETELFYASSSKIFGKPNIEPQDENTAINPLCMYGITKATGLSICRMYRNKHRVFASTGILYNHESSLRSQAFVSQKIIKNAVKIKNGKLDKLILNNLEDKVDWGYAPDFVEAFHKIMSLDEPDDFIVATGIKYSVRDFVKITFDFLNLDWEHFVHATTNNIYENRVSLVGNSSKLFKTTGWQPSIDLKTMIGKLLVSEGADINEK